MSLLSAVKTWIDGADWRSWVAHSIVGALIACVSHAIGFGVAASVWCVFTLFFVRECEQALLAIVAKERPHWNDALWDFVCPTVAALVVTLLL